MSERADEPAESGDASGGVLSPRQRTYLRRLGHGLAILLVLVLVVPFVVYAVPQVAGAEHSYVVLSGSMEPTLSPGDVTVVDAVDPAAVENGDIITYLRDGESRTTTHRVVEVVEQDGEPAFRTKGDNNEDPDQGVVTASQLRGRVMTVDGTLVVFPFAGHVVQFANTQTGFAMLFVVPMVLLVANEIWNVVSSVRNPSSETGTAEGGRGEGSDGNSDRIAVPPEAVERIAAFEGSSTAGISASDRLTDESAREVSDSPTAGTVSFRPSELRLSVLVLGAFAVYSGATAVLSPGVWTIGVAASVGAAFFLLGGLYLRGRLAADGESSTAESGDEPDGVLIEPTPETATDDSRTEPVSSLERLVELASATDARVRRHAPDGSFSLSDDSTVYVYESDHGSSDSLDSLDGEAAGAEPHLDDASDVVGTTGNPSSSEADDD